MNEKTINLEFLKTKVSEDTALLIHIVQSMGELFLEGYSQTKEDTKISEKSHRADLVTHFDKLIEEKLTLQLNVGFPEFDILGEETFDKNLIGEELKLKNTFVIDPIDGTMNFIHQIPLVSISVGMIKDGELYAGVIFNPVSNELYYAEKGKGAFCNTEKISTSTDDLNSSVVFMQPSHRKDIRVTENIETYTDLQEYIYDKSLSTRSFRSTAIELCYVAHGKLGLFIFHRVNIWDVIAGLIIINEADGDSMDLEGNEFILNYIETSGGILGNKKILAEIKKIFIKNRTCNE